MKRRPPMGPMATRAMNDLNTQQYDMSRIDLFGVLVYQKKAVFIIWFVVMMFCLDKQMTRYGVSLSLPEQDYYLVLTCFLLILLLKLFWDIFKAYKEVVWRRRWAEGLRIEPPLMFATEIKAGLLKPEDIEPSLGMAGPVADHTRNEIKRLRRKNIVRLMSQPFGVSSPS